MKQGSLFLIAWTFGVVAVGSCTKESDGGGEAGAASGSGGSGASGMSATGGSGTADGGASGAGTAGRADGGAESGTGGSAGAGVAGAAAGSGGSAGSAVDAGGGGVAADGGEPTMTFFVTSSGNPTGNLNGLEAADMKCQDLAAAVGHGDKTWRAYLSVEAGPGGMPVHAKDRIGQGPWHNADGVVVAADLTELHGRDGDSSTFLDETGEPVPGQWQGSPTPNVHDVLTGTSRDGTLNVGYTCADWTSDDANLTAWVGHSDGLGPSGSTDAMYRPWNSVHENGGCSDTAPRGGGGRIYCFAAGE